MTATFPLFRYGDYQPDISPAQALLIGGVAVGFCALVIEIMVRFGVLDHPGHRSSHTQPTPKGGGIGIIGAFLLCLPLEHAVCGLPVLTAHLALLMAGVIVLAAVSWLDDIHSFAARYKLAAQVVAAFLVTASAGVPTPWLILAVFGTVFVTNAINFIDGINGLASGVMMLTALALALCRIDAPAFLLLAACFATFLPSNFPRARIFMGDVGSQAGALVIAWGGIINNGRGSVLVLLALNGVIWDVSFTLLRRFASGERLAEPHRGHLFQLAVRSGISAPAVTLLHWGFTVIGAAMAESCPLDVAVPVLAGMQITWTGMVVHRARRTLRTRW